MPPETLWKKFITESEQETNEFAASGGDILEFYDDGRPKRWRCGRGENGEPLDPLQADRKNILHRLTADGSWEGVNPTADDIAELKQWRSDWSDLHRSKRPSH